MPVPAGVIDTAQPVSIAPPAGPDPAPTGARSSRIVRGARELRTARHLALAQLAARARFMLLRRAYALAPERPILAARRAAAGARTAGPLPVLSPDLLVPGGPEILARRAAALARGHFAYLGREVDYSAGIRWHDPGASPLWAFNLHYLGAVLELVLAGDAAAARRILSAWCADFGARWDRVAWHPYPTSLRLANLCFAAAQLGGFDALDPAACDLTATHAAYLLRHLERDLRGNHLFENAFALLVAGAYLDGSLAARCAATARQILAAEVPEQVRADGSHFELSPMYHAIVMQRCLQALALLDGDDPLARGTLAPAVQRMARFLAGILCPDGDIPPLGDAVRGFAPPPGALLALAERLAGACAAPPPVGVTSFDDAGLHVLRSARVWAIFDAGPVCPDYLPGHGQADSLTVEVWCDGTCIVGDPGVHEYSGPERAWGRSSRAHSTLTVDDADTSEVYGSFRVGGRARIGGVAREPHAVAASLNPFGVAAHFVRRVELAAPPADRLEIIDQARAPAGRTVRSRLHLHPAIRLVNGLSADGRAVVVRSTAGAVHITAQHPLRVEPGRASRQYGVVEPTTILVQELEATERGDLLGGMFSIEPLGSR